MRSEYSAGGIVMRRQENNHLKFLIIRDSHGNWAFPKGRVEPNESVSEAAQREISEETGITALQLINPLGSIAFQFQDKWEEPGEIVEKHIAFFLFESTDTTEEATHQIHEVQATDWVALDELTARITYTNLQPIIHRLKEVLI